MFGKFNRSNFLDSQVVNNNIEKDLVLYSWDKFKMLRSGYRYRIPEVLIHRPEFLAYKFYGSIDYWWIIAKVNNIDDWWNDLTPGQVIIIPDISDIENFYAEVIKN